MLKSKKVSRIISALLVVMLVASLGITTVSAKNNDDEAFTFTFNATTPMSWTKSRAKEGQIPYYLKGICKSLVGGFSVSRKVRRFHTKLGAKSAVIFLYLIIAIAQGQIQMLCAKSLFKFLS